MSHTSAILNSEEGSAMEARQERVRRGLILPKNIVRRLDEALTVETEVLEVGGATTRLRQTVRNKDGICARLVVRLACVRVDGSKPGRIPSLWRERLTAMRDKPAADGSC